MRPTPAWSIAAATLLLAAPVPAASVDPGAQPAMSTAGGVLAFAVAQNGVMLAATADPGSSVPAPGDPGPAVPTWYLWDRDGNPIHSGSGDHPTCAQRTGDLCQTHLQAAALSTDGLMFAVGAALPASTDSLRGMVLAGRTIDGEPVSRMYQGTVTRLALSGGGTTVAAATRVDPVLPDVPPGAKPTGAVEVMAFDGSHFVGLWPSPAPLPAPVSNMAMTPDGQRLAVAADHLYVYQRSSPTPATITSVSGAPGAVAAGEDPAHSVLAGYPSGTIALFDDGATLTPRASYPVGHPVTAIAMDGTHAVVGDDAGRILAFKYGSGSWGFAAPQVLTAAPDAIRQISLSADGATVLVRSQTTLHLYQAANGTLASLWSATPATAPAGSGLDASGALSAAAGGTAVTRFLAKHVVQADAVPELLAQPGSSRDIDITYRNLGNRFENVTVGVDFGDPMFALLRDPAFQVAPGASHATSLHLVVGDAATPGTRPVHLLHETSSGATGTLEIRVRVLERDALALDETGPLSLNVKPGETVHFQAKLENRGNAPVTADLRAEADPGWTAAVAPAHASLAAGQAATLDVSLTAPPAAKDGTHATARITLVDRPGQELDFVGVVGGRLQPLLQVAGLFSTGPGALVDIPVSVANGGNVADAYDLTVSGFVPDGWTVTWDAGPSQRTPTLEPGTGRAFPLHVSVPADAAGARVALTLLATSAGNPDLQATRLVLVQVAPASDAPHGTPGPGLAPLMGMVLLAACLVARRATLGRPPPSI